MFVREQKLRMKKLQYFIYFKKFSMCTSKNASLTILIYGNCISSIFDKKSFY